jgi:hypothetical protein
MLAVFEGFNCLLIALICLKRKGKKFWIQIWFQNKPFLLFKLLILLFNQMLVALLFLEDLPTIMITETNILLLDGIVIGY